MYCGKKLVEKLAKIKNITADELDIVGETTKKIKQYYPTDGTREYEQVSTKRWLQILDSLIHAEQISAVKRILKRRNYDGKGNVV